MKIYILFVFPGLPWNKPQQCTFPQTQQAKKTEPEWFHSVNLTLGNTNSFMPKRVWVKSFVATASEKKYEDICGSKRLNFLWFLGFYVQNSLCASKRLFHVSWVCAHAQVKTEECILLSVGAYVMWMCGSGKKKVSDCFGDGGLSKKGCYCFPGSYHSVKTNESEWVSENVFWKYQNHAHFPSFPCKSGRARETPGRGSEPWKYVLSHCCQAKRGSARDPRTCIWSLGNA